MAQNSETLDHITPFRVEDLHFDPQNPRLAEFGIHGGQDESEIISLLWDAMDVRELVQSIAASGFFKHEAVIVSEEDGRHIVIEGNRRLAAVKALLNPETVETGNWEIPRISREAKEALETIPGILSTREAAWRFLGFKHVNGPAKWSSYAKANYIAGVHEKYGIALADIANQIGDRHNTVQRLYRGLMVLKQAEAKGVYDREDRARPRLAFSHLYTALDYDGFKNFLSLRPKEEESENPVPDDKLGNLGEVLLWLYGSKSESIDPIIESQNPHLRQLDEVLRDREAVAAIRSGGSLQKAFEISQPPESIFEQSLTNAKMQLTQARAYLSTGYDKSEELLRLAGTIANVADDLYQEMERKRNPKSKERLSE